MLDQYGRDIHYMRISITDRCNLRCQYCMPDGTACFKKEKILSFNEIIQVVKAASQLGISKIKLTGGEPLVRKDVATLIRMLKSIDGIEEVTLTSNGVLLEKMLPDLIEAGLDAVNISLDTLDREVFSSITGFDLLNQVKRSIEKAIHSPIRVKINAVLMKKRNEEEWRSLLEYARKYDVCVRFIEMMPIGMGTHFQGLSNEELLSKIKEIYPGLKADAGHYGNGPAVYVSIPGFIGRIGFISAMHGKFCSSCNRIRMTSTGLIKPCLCFGATLDIKPILDRNDEEELKEALRKAIYQKPDAHCFESLDSITESHNMYDIGG